MASLSVSDEEINERGRVSSSSDNEESMYGSIEGSDGSSGSEMAVESRFVPYQDEPLAPPGQENIDEEERDIDKLMAHILAEREDGDILLNEWCQCKHCSKDNLSGAVEHRCCREVLNMEGKLVFDGSIERLHCITEHEDYKAITNRAVLETVAPLLKETSGHGYRRRAGVSQNEFLRAVAYRWTVRWLCGYMGWDNRRPLSACVYQDIRTRFETRHRQPRGYRNAQAP